MGGNLFPGKRANNDEYARIGREITERLSTLGVNCLIPDSLKDKEAHGDIDIICSFPPLSNEQLRSVFGPDLQIHRNTDTVSIFYEAQYQADLCFHPAEDLESAFNYNRGSDAGNLIGVLYSRVGFSYGHKGLQYYVNLSKEDCLGAILVSKDQRKILEFVGLDYDKWLQGFDSRVDLYSWVIQSRYFNKDFYQYCNLNHVNKVRQKKRPVYREFLEWLEDKPANDFAVGDKSDYIWKAMLHFGCEWFSAAAPLIDNRRRKLAVRSIFSGSDILGLGFAGKELGAKLEKFKLQFENWNETVLASTKEEMIEKFLQFEKSIVS